MSHTFFWHDYESFGLDPRRTRPAQFAGVRTDAQLNEIEPPLMLYCQPAPDFLPEPQACLITGITPQLCLERGAPEHQFAAAIEAALGQSGTIGVGYNSIRYDDELTRFLFWRNLIDPYAREWQNQCGRWDLLDVVRLCHALRPEGIHWPQKEDGTTSFKLEDLSHANGLVHEAAHDALSDVRATLALARLIRDRQPRLFEFALGLHKKERVAAELGLPATRESAKPFLHVSGMFDARRGCLALMWPLASHPSNRNELLAWDLSQDPVELATLNAADIRERLFTRASDLPEGISRLPIKSVHLNKSPMVVSHLKTLRPELAQRWGLDLEQAALHAEHARALPDLGAIWSQVFERPAPEQAPDVDGDLYGGFVGNEDRRRLNRLRNLSAAELAKARSGFDDARLEELLFRYRARNFASSLSPDETQRWQAHCAARLLHGHDGALSVQNYQSQIDELAQSPEWEDNEPAQQTLQALYDYAERIVAPG